MDACTARTCPSGWSFRTKKWYMLYCPIHACARDEKDDASSTRMLRMEASPPSFGCIAVKYDDVYGRSIRSKLRVVYIVYIEFLSFRACESCSRREWHIIRSQWEPSGDGEENIARSQYMLKKTWSERSLLYVHLQKKLEFVRRVVIRGLTLRYNVWDKREQASGIWSNAHFVEGGWEPMI